jgi:hypothetical protein
MAIDALGIELPFPALAVETTKDPLVAASCFWAFLGNKSPDSDKYIFPHVQVESQGQLSGRDSSSMWNESHCNWSGMSPSCSL